MHPAAAIPAASKPENLALLYQNVLTGVVRIRAGRLPLNDVEVFRTLQEVEHEAGVAGYRSNDIRDAEFAVVALLDETILSLRDAKAEEWRKKPLNIELFGQAIAGDVFFDKLADIERRGDSPQLADLLEVYLLCLLLGFEGRFAPPLLGELSRIAERLRRRIELIRGIDYRLSPPMEFTQGPAEAPAKAPPKWLWWVVGALAFALFLLLIYHWNLAGRVDRLQSASLPHPIAGESA